MSDPPDNLLDLEALETHRLPEPQNIGRLCGVSNKTVNFSPPNSGRVYRELRGVQIFVSTRIIS